MTALVSQWPGTYEFEARQAYIRSRSEGMSLTRSVVVGSIGSFQDAWIFRKNLAKFIGCSVRTVQRAITEAKTLGLIGVARSKPNEIPKGLQTPLPCGWSHRWVVGWGKAAAVASAEIARTRLARIVKMTCGGKVRRPDPPRYPTHKKEFTAEEIQAVIDGQLPREKDYGSRPARKWSVEEIDAELARLKSVRQNE